MDEFGDGCADATGNGGWKVRLSGAPESLYAIQVAMLGKLTYTAMADAIFTHPLLAEGLNTLFAMFDA
ncbi:hypothetical protein [Nocardia vinacea]|uniref:hypothetical protein n=1 Tax=Nocardia vinacea TaxID=96468 RepID=UPI0003077C3A|nr:hypothetical protein [Nocardia vinacea]